MNRGVALFGQISEINDHLYLSGAGVLKPETLRKKNISLIINVTTEEPSFYMNGIEYLKLRIDDSPSARLDTYFDLVADRIKANRDRGGRSLVHCVAGVSRSASLCIVYLMKYQKMSLRQAYLYVKGVRSIIRPNIGFWRQMIDYERRFRGLASVELVAAPNGARDADGQRLMIPDVYANELRRQMLLANSSSSSSSSSAAAAAEAEKNGNLFGHHHHGFPGVVVAPTPAASSSRPTRALSSPGSSAVGGGNSYATTARQLSSSSSASPASGPHSSATARRLTASARSAALVRGQQPSRANSAALSRLVMASGAYHGSALKPKTKNKLFDDFNTRQEFFFPAL